MEISDELAMFTPLKRHTHKFVDSFYTDKLKKMKVANDNFITTRLTVRKYAAK